MCQGVIVSLVKWQGKTKKIRQSVLSGIGSHSILMAKNKKKLNRLGWTENAPNQEAISIESDFSAWNKFTIESGKPSDSDLAILKREYKRCAENAQALIAHVKLHKRVDESLVALLMAPAQKIYDETCTLAQKIYDETCTSAPAQKIYDETWASAWCKLFAKKSNRIKRLQ